MKILSNDLFSVQAPELFDFTLENKSRLYGQANPDGKYGMGEAPHRWAACAESLFKGGQADHAILVLEEYFKEHANKVDAYKSYETAPLRLYAKLLIHKGDFKGALAKIEEAMNSEHKVPADHEVFVEVNIKLEN